MYSSSSSSSSSSRQWHTVVVVVVVVIVVCCCDIFVCFSFLPLVYLLFTILGPKTNFCIQKYSLKSLFRPNVIIIRPCADHRTKSHFGMQILVVLLL